MKRQRGRNRGGGGGGKPNAGNANRAFDSNGPDGVKIRGAAQHVFEKYQQLARDAAGGGDRVLAENYLQHAEHYFRLIRTLQPQRPPAEIMGRETFASGYDIDFEDESGAQALPIEPEGEAAAGAEGQAAEGQGGEGRSEGRDQRDRGEGRRDDREFRRDREGRGDRESREGYGQRGEGRRDERDSRGEGRGDRQDRGEPRADRGERPERGDRPEREPRADRAERGDRPEREPRGDRAERGDRPRRDREFGRDRPRRDDAREPVSADAESPGTDDDGHMLRDASGGFSPAPAFLQAAAPAPVESDEPEVERPARSSRRRAAPVDDAASEAAGEAPTAAEEAEEV